MVQPPGHVTAVHQSDVQAVVGGRAVGEFSTIANSEWSIVAGLACIFLTFVIGRFLEHRDFPYLPEAGVAVLIGMAASAIAVGAGRSLIVADMRFDFEFFMIWLLPPIIFEAGFNMNRRAFFENVFPTALFAFVGTLASAAIVGCVVYAAGQAGLCHPLGGLAALTFGSMISAVDPVTVLAVFQRLGVKADLFAMVFGESVMNDAVAIVLSRTLLAFKAAPVDSRSVAMAAAAFAEIFAGSVLIGCAFGAASALAYKHLHMRAHDDALYVEAVMIVTFAWGANYTAEALGLSGIVAILFCGIVMAKYTRDNLSEAAKVLTARTFKVVALLAETFVFVYLGMAAFALPIFKNTTWRLVGVALPACLLGRCHVYVLSALVNCWRRHLRTRELRLAAAATPSGVASALGMKSRVLPDISRTYQHVMVFSGLRGGVAFAIASVGFSHEDFTAHDDSLAIMQTTMMVALFTIFVCGGLIADVARAAGVLEASAAAHAHAAAHAAAAHAVAHGPSASCLTLFDSRHVRPFLTHARHDAARPTGSERGVELISDGELGLHADRPPLSRLHAGLARERSDQSDLSAEIDAVLEEVVPRAPALDVHYEPLHHAHEGHHVSPRDREVLVDALETLP